MGFGLRFREKVKQVGKKSSQPDKNGFIATNYERVQLTYDEAVAFASSLKTIRKRISDAHEARTRMLKEVERTLTGSLPRIHEIDPVSGEHHTSEAAPEGHEGDYVHTGTLTRLTDENDLKVQTQVFDPIDKWISEVDLFKGKMKILENLRLELDGSRRDHITIENKIAKQEAKASEVDAKHTTHIQSKDASVAGKRTAYEQYEAQVYEELVQLIGESGMLHSALDRAMKLEIEVYQRAADPISTTTARLEQLSSAGGSGITSPVSSSQYTPAGAAQATTFAPGTNYGGQGQYAGGQGQYSGGQGQYSAQPNIGGSASAGSQAYPSAPTSQIPSSGGGVSQPTVRPSEQNVQYERPYGA